MRPCFHIEIETPKGVRLQGLWLGPRRAKQVIVWVHGLGSSMYSKLYIADELVGSTTAVLVFNNRGHDKVASGSTGRNKRVRHGAAHEVFTECVDDIQGAINYARKAGARSVFLAGHSTGCQKAAYWASRKGRGVSGVILLAPMSDYASELSVQGEKILRRAEAVARRLVKSGKSHELLPEKVWSWSWLADAQRYLSLYTGRSAEEIFTYWDPARKPRTLASIHKPLLILLAEEDEYADRPAAEIARWFEQHVKKGKVAIIPRVPHSFQTGQKSVARRIREFMKEN